ncbi:MAG: hypothetical protein COA74_12025 [Gammaproteobacteria bacterium]|nr:MAG: hypothetical protein COA74_12025 [Gammaproteobacteria bacterium]
MVLILLSIVGIIVIIFLNESLEKKSTQSRFIRLKLISLQIICTLALALLIIIFFSDVLNASEAQIEIIGAMSIAMSYLLCAYIFRRK